MRPEAESDFGILLCFTADDCGREGESGVTQRVNSANASCYKLVIRLARTQMILKHFKWQ
jgi:hypothetical protein